MKETVERLVKQIEEKGGRLQTKFERQIASIDVPSVITSQPVAAKSDYSNFAFAGAVGAFVGGFIAEKDTRLGLWFCGAVLAICGFYLKNKSGKSQLPAANTNPDKVISSAIDKVIEAKKALDSEWEEFMDLKQKEIRQSINSLNIDEESKRRIGSNVYSYEELDISLRDLTERMQNASISNLEQAKGVIVGIVKKKIEETVRKQIEKYRETVK